MAEIKRSTAIWFRVLGVLGILLVAGIYVWVFLIGGRGREVVASAGVDGRITYNADEEINAAMEKWEEGCGQVPVIASDYDQAEKTVALAFCGLSDPAENDRVLELLEEYGFQATFFLSGMEAAENGDFVQAVSTAGNDLGSMSLNEDTGAQGKNQTQLIEEFVRSRKVLTMLTDRPTGLLYLEDFSYTANVRQAAKASGYSAVVEPGNLIDYSSIEGSQEALAFVKALQKGELLMISMDKLEIIPEEPRVEPDVPAKDKQAGIKTVNETEKEEGEKIARLVEELFAALKEEGFRTVPVKSLSARSEDEGYETETGCGALVYQSFLTDQKAVALALWGLPDSEGLDEIVTLLREFNADATFFVTEQEAKDRGEEIGNLEKLGFTIGNGGNGKSRTENGMKLEEEILSCTEAVNKAAKNSLMLYLPIGRLPLGQIWTETELRQAAKKAGCSVIAPKEANPEEPFPGALYGVELTSEKGLECLKQILERAEANGFGVWDVGAMLEGHGKIEALTDSQIELLRENNHGNLEEPLSYVYTTERAMSFLFYGVKNKPVMLDIVNRLLEKKSSGTFFATFNELQNSQEQIEEILRAGNELGIAYVESSSYPAEFKSVMRYLHSCQVYAAWRYGVEISTVFFPYGDSNQETEEAVSAMGLKSAGCGVSMIQSKHKGMTLEDMPDVLNSDFKNIALTRGAMVYFNGNYVQCDQELENDYRGKTICGELVDAVFERFVEPIAWCDMTTGEIAENSRYQVKPCSELMDSTFCYQLSADTKDCEISMDRNILADMENDEERFGYIVSRYVGNSSADKAPKLPGFTGKEIRQLDKTGRFTDDPVLFLTFDDWGSDQSLNHLLYILDKYNVKATFFVRANHVKSNPNLLRAIAEAGHEIASHSYSHMPLADYEEDRNCYVSLTDEEADALRKDLVASYEELYRYVGDVTVNGIRSLSTNFRPPTLAVSKVGLSQVFDTGFSYSISGDCSLNDYEAETLEEVTDQLRKGIKEWNRRIPVQNGSVIVMHMSDNSRFTAAALDEMIPVWIEQGYQFARIDRYLYEEEYEGESMGDEGTEE